MKLGIILDVIILIDLDLVFTKALRIVPGLQNVSVHDELVLLQLR